MTDREIINELHHHCCCRSCTNCALADNRKCLWLSESDKLGLDCGDLYKTEEGRELAKRLYLRIYPPLNVDEQSYLNLFR